MINAIITGIIKIMMSIVNIVLWPIDATISAMFPDVNGMLQLVSNGFDTATQYFGWLVDATMLTREVIGFFIISMTFRLTAPYIIYAFKFALGWYRELKL